MPTLPLEHELLSRRRFAAQAQARTEVAGWIDRYNPHPPTLGDRDALTRRP